MHSKIFASSQQQSPALCSIKSTPSQIQNWRKKKKIYVQIKKRKRERERSTSSSMSLHTDKVIRATNKYRHSYSHTSTWASGALPTSVILKVFLLKVCFQLLLSPPLLFHLLLLQLTSYGLQTNKPTVNTLSHMNMKKSLFGPICNKYVALFCSYSFFFFYQSA